ncbi:MAG: hypothetical protein AAF420_01650 [Pseudomonadota bacterium]
MPQLIVALLGLALIVFIAVVIAAVALSVLAIAAAAAGLFGVYQAGVTFWQIAKARIAAPPVLGPNAEASVGYFFGPVVQDVKRFFKDNYAQNIAYAKSVETQIDHASEEWIQACWWVWMALLYLFGALLTLISWVLAVVIAGPIALLLAIWFGVLYVVDYAYLWALGFFAVCPSCDASIYHAHYQCSACGKRHRHLRVNKMGALHHRCACGNKLASHVLSGRGNADQAYCPNEAEGCTQAINQALVTHVAVPIAIAGATSSGKTVLKLAAIDWLLNHFGKQPGIRVDFEDAGQRAEINSQLERLRQDDLPPKTTTVRHRAYTLAVDYPEQRSELLYLYDPAGETFQNRDLIDQHRFFGNIAAMILVVDPFSIRTLADKARALGKWPELVRNASPSTDSIVNVLSHSLNTMHRIGAFKGSDGRFPVRLCVFVTKVDVLQVGDEIDQQIKCQSEQTSDLARSNGVRAWLVANDMGDLLRLIDANFSHVRYFYGSPRRLSQGDNAQFSALMNYIGDSVLQGATRKPVLDFVRSSNYGR